MSLATRIMTRVLKLEKPTHKLVVDKDLAMTTSDGVVLLAHRYHGGQSAPAPAILMRSPYDRQGLLSFEAALFAQRGFQIVIQSCRGTFGSGGEFSPYRNEQRDGAEAVAWVKAQPWCDGRVVTYGGSYCGMTQWASIAGGAEGVEAMALQVTSARPTECLVFPGGAFALETKADWVHGLYIEERRSLLTTIRGWREMPEVLKKVAATPALKDVDTVARGERIEYFQDWINHPDTDDAWWAPSDFRDGIKRSPEHLTSLGGWFDFFIPAQVKDVVELQQRGLRPQLRIGPWKHGGGLEHRVKDGMTLFSAVFNGNVPLDPSPIQLQLYRATDWLGFDAWPPPSAAITFNLQADGSLSTLTPGAEAAGSSYTYDPHNPTPSIGGTQLGSGAGPKDQKAREDREDVLTFTTPAFTKETRIAGDLSATIHLTTSLAHSDLFLRLCLVDAKGVSTNVADGILRLTPENGLGVAGKARAVTLEMFPVGVLVAPGERLRLQVSNGAHPLYSRNWGTGEHIATAADGPSCEVTVHHDATRPSSITLPVLAR